MYWKLYLNWMRIEILTVPGCPNRWRAFIAVTDALTRLGRSDVVVVEREIADDGAASEARMSGSPTILLDGRDLFPDSAGQPSMSCRLYGDGGSLVGAPSVESLVEGIGRR